MPTKQPVRIDTERRDGAEDPPSVGHARAPWHEEAPGPELAARIREAERSDIAELRHRVGVYGRW